MGEWMLLVAFIVFVGHSSAVLLEPTATDSTTLCSDTLPAAQFFEYGYDLSEFDLFSCPDIGGKRAKIARFNVCDKETKYKSYEEDRRVYDVPDVFDPVYETWKVRNPAIRVYHHISDIKRSFLDDQIKITSVNEINGIADAFHRNSEFYEEFDAVLDNRVAIAMSYYQFDFSSITTNWAPFYKGLTNAFKDDINAIPNYFKNNEDAYLHFLEKYGTHTLSGAQFGGIVYRTSFVASTENYTAIANEMGKDVFMINKNVQIVCKDDKKSRKVWKVFDSIRNFTQVMIGLPDISLLQNDITSNNSFTMPVNLMKSSSAIIEATMVPISNLMFDNVEKYESMKTAIRIYMDKAKLKASVRNMRNLMDTGRSTRNKSTAIELIAKFEQSKYNYNATYLNELFNSVSREVYFIKQNIITNYHSN